MPIVNFCVDALGCFKSKLHSLQLDYCVMRSDVLVGEVWWDGIFGLSAFRFCICLSDHRAKVQQPTQPVVLGTLGSEHRAGSRKLCAQQDTLQLRRARHVVQRLVHVAARQPDWQPGSTCQQEATSPACLFRMAEQPQNDPGLAAKHVLPAVAAHVGIIVQHMLLAADRRFRCNVDAI
jgi:hypothetical protein